MDPCNTGTNPFSNIGNNIEYSLYWRFVNATKKPKITTKNKTNVLTITIV